MPLAPVDLLAAVEAAALGTDDGVRLDGLGVDGRCPKAGEKTLADWSAGGPVAYVEAEYFGRVGEQRAAVWDGSTIMLGPLHVEESQPFPSAGSPISQALRRLGVAVSAGEDEFSAVGLDRHRSGEAWIA